MTNVITLNTPTKITNDILTEAANLQQRFTEAAEQFDADPSYDAGYNDALDDLVALIHSYAKANNIPVSYLPHQRESVELT